MKGRGADFMNIFLNFNQFQKKKLHNLNFSIELKMFLHNMFSRLSFLLLFNIYLIDCSCCDWEIMYI